ncbi:MAG: hypothetical protein JXR87_02355 [Candidatus Marinimicrobia bacterium]|nr:hypothetical protein [Candidatus Neomarinimicrobiota bacterium]
MSVPHLIWPQEDVIARQIQIEEAKRILIAARQSDFKEEIINAIIEKYNGTQIAVKIIGLNDIGQESPENYKAVIVLNTCMSWDMDRNVNSFLKAYPNSDNIIILTTSGDGGWLPKKKGRQFDAISSASKIADVDKISKEIIEKINHLLN